VAFVIIFLKLKYKKIFKILKKNEMNSRTINKNEK